MNGNETAFEKAKNKALNILSHRMHSEKELTDKLVRAGFDGETANEVIVWMREYEFVDDTEYSRVFTTDCINYKKYGIRRIKQALIYKGINQYTIEDVLCEFDVDEADALVPLVKKKLGGDFERKNIDRTIRHFVAKGYAFADIKNAIDTVKSDFESGEDDDIEL